MLAATNRYGEDATLMLEHLSPDATQSKGPYF